MVRRVFSHVLAPFSAALLELREGFGALEQVVSASESRHTGQICFVIEPGLSIASLLGKVSARRRAERVFSDRRLWDTSDNNGVLIYLLLADRNIEIVADRGICSYVSHEEWEQICRTIEDRCGNGDIKGGVLQGILEVSALLEKFFPARGERENTIPDSPEVI